MNSETKFYQSTAFFALITGFILLIPLTAMQFTDEVVWTLSDFVFAGAMIFGTGVFYKFITRKSESLIYRFAIGFGMLTGFALIWVNLAVGIVGSANNPANLLYFVVIVVGFIGAFISRFEAEKMTLVMFAMTLTQGLIATLILAFGLYKTPPVTIIHIIGVNGFFMVLFSVSGLFFRYAGQKHIDTTTKTTNSAS